MSEFNLNLSAGEKKRLLTGGKYCPDDIVVEAVGVDPDAIFEAGKQAEHDRFWDAVQDNGNRTIYRYAFYGWRYSNFKPKYDMKPTEGAFMFGSLDRPTGWEGKSFVDALSQAGVTLDTSECAEMSGMFYSAYTSDFPEIVVAKKTSLAQMFYNCPYLEEITITIYEDCVTSFANTFYYCPKLKRLNLNGVIDCTGFDVRYSTELEHDSLVNILNKLKNFAGSGKTYTVILGTTNLAKLTDVEKAIATEKGWTLT